MKCRQKKSGRDTGHILLALIESVDDLNLIADDVLDRGKAAREFLAGDLEDAFLTVAKGAI